MPFTIPLPRDSTAIYFFALALIYISLGLLMHGLVSRKVMLFRMAILD